MTTHGRETAVRDYLTALSNPEALHDEQAAKNIEQQLARSTDPVERVKLQQQRLDAQQVDLAALEEAFIKHAKAWADEQGVSAQAFRDEGVPAGTLRAAGFRIRGGGRPAAKVTRRRRGRVSAEDIEKKIRARRAEFTVAQIVKDTGASIATVRKVVGQMIENGELEEAGERREGRGRAAKTYKKK